MTISKYTVKDIVRFWSKVNVTEKVDDCWEWTASLQNKGYGQFQHGGRAGTMKIASRVSWEIAYGSIPKGVGVLHDCDNPKCVNPNHLFLGTQKRNMEDAVQKGRQAHGERSGAHKLTVAKVIEIRKRYNDGGISQETLAQEMGVTRRTIGRVVSKSIWKEVGE